MKNKPLRHKESNTFKVCMYFEVNSYYCFLKLRLLDLVQKEVKKFL